MFERSILQQINSRVVEDRKFILERFLSMNPADLFRI